MLEKAIAGRWIAGERVSDALRVASSFNRKGIGVMVNYLGEDFSKTADVEETMGVYARLVSDSADREISISMAVKPTQLGLDLGRKYAQANYSALVKLARKNKIFVWLDMEGHEYVDDTIAIYLGESARGGVGICIQSYLRRSESDVKRLVRRGAVIRLVKGAYSESRRIAFPDRQKTTANYVLLMEYLFRHSKSFMIATHDASMIEKALELEKGSKADVTFAMLNGIRNDYAARLAKDGENVCIYVPFGGRWVSYGYRRTKELENSKLILRSLLGEHS